MHLLIDLGNSRLKWALNGQNRWLTGAVAHRGMDINILLDGAWGGVAAPARIVMASVAQEETRRAVESWTQRQWGALPHQLRASREQLGVTNTYRDAAALGADRWAALIGARALSARACAVVSCGTAVTVDALAADGVFAGGVILPGLQLMRRSLAAGTARIGLAEGDAKNCLAQQTADAVAGGTVFGLAGAIERCVKEQERVLGTAFEVFITGGDAMALAPLLERPTKHEPELVLRGLARVAESMP